MPQEAHARQAFHTQLLDIDAQYRAAVDSEQRILSAAQDRLSKVQQHLKTVRPQAVIDQDAGERYLDLILERGQLQQVIALAEHHLKHGWEEPGSFNSKAACTAWPGTIARLR